MKKINTHSSISLLLLSFALIFTFCRDRASQLDQLVVRISDDPDRLHPIIARSSISYQILNKIFQPLADYDPETLQMVPVLLDSISGISAIDTGMYAGFYLNKLTIHPDATWSDGIPVTVEDVRFTMKSALVCEWYGSGIPGLLSELVNIEQGVTEKEVLVYFKSDNPQVSGGFLLFPVMPAHFYDEEGGLSDLDLGEALDSGNSSWLQQNENWTKFAEIFNGTEYSREKIMGSGPYRFTNWIDRQLISLEKDPKYWGEELSSERSILTALPSGIIYRIVPEELTAVDALREGTIDILGDFSPDQFMRIKSMSDSTGNIKTYTPDVLQYFYTCINNRDLRLADTKVRKALAHLLPTDMIIDQLFSGLASPIAGPIHPVKPYYNSTLQPVSNDVEQAKLLLKEAGWADTDGNGILDKVIDGQFHELQLPLSTSQRKLGQDISLIFQESAAKAGVRIEINVVDNPTLVQEVTERRFVLANLASRFEPGLDELKSTWHSSSTSGVGNNISGFANEQADRIIDSIQTVSMDQEQLNSLYRHFQKIIHDEQPVLFICAPKERIAARATIDLPTTVLKPGYIERLAKPAN